MNTNKEYLAQEYRARINRVIDYIEKNIDSELSLEKLAEIANFSQFHFHRIFKGIMHETLNSFIQRLRITKAAGRLLADPKESITNVAFDFGFSGSATFARAFRDYFGMSASDWRNGGWKESKICKSDSNFRIMESSDGKAFEFSTEYIYDGNSNQTRRIEMSNKNEIQVDVREIEKFHVAYVRHVGPYKGDNALFEQLFTKLFTWAGPRGLCKSPETKVIAMYHDDPKMTDEAKLRTSVCISVPEDTQVDGEIGKMEIEGGTYAIAHFELKSDEYEAAWNAVYGGWLPQSGYQPVDGPPFEMYLNDPKEHPEGKCVVDIYIPVKPM